MVKSNGSTAVRTSARLATRSASIKQPTLSHTPKASASHSRQLPPSKPSACSIPDVEDLRSASFVSNFSPSECSLLRLQLLEWYDSNHRVLPWRYNAKSLVEPTAPPPDDPQHFAYAVWVSEVMSQQTQIVTVIPYFERWLKRWPTVAALAKATLEEVNELWAGLGYYRRAKFLWEGADYLVKHHNGQLPCTVEQLRKIPGIGPYTAGAIASVAFSVDTPVVDGNVIRVLSRLRAISADPKAAQTVATHWRLAAQLVDRQRPGDWNQAMMELGALICTPGNPKCSQCPVSTQCHAYAGQDDNGRPVTDYPSKVVRRPQRKEQVAVCVVQLQAADACFYLLVQRPESGLLAGLWEFPAVVLASGASTSEASLRAAMNKHLLKGLGISITTCKVLRRSRVGQLRHIFSHVRHDLHVEQLVIEGSLSELQAQTTKSAYPVRWVDSRALPGTGLTTGVRKVYDLVTRAPTKLKAEKEARTRTGG
eukprot:jgi/Chlat1/4309/Chrsp29S04478